MEVLEKLWFVIDDEKSNFIPNQNCQFLGFIIHSSQMTLELPERKQGNIKSKIKNLKGNDECRTYIDSVMYSGKVWATASKYFEPHRYLELLTNGDIIQYYRQSFRTYPGQDGSGGHIAEVNWHLAVWQNRKENSTFIILSCWKISSASMFRQKVIRVRNIVENQKYPATVSYINRVGGVQYPELNDIPRNIWSWCEERELFVFYIT